MKWKQNTRKWKKRKKKEISDIQKANSAKKKKKLLLFSFFLFNSNFSYVILDLDLTGREIREINEKKQVLDEGKERRSVETLALQLKYIFRHTYYNFYNFFFYLNLLSFFPFAQNILNKHVLFFSQNLFLQSE